MPLDEHEHRETQLIDERDRAEEALSQAYYLIMGRAAEWSNHFAHDEALEDIDDAQTSLRKELKYAISSRDDVARCLVEAEDRLVQCRLDYADLRERLAAATKKPRSSAYTDPNVQGTAPEPDFSDRLFPDE